METESRILKVPIPAPVIRQMDELILREAGGLRTRAEFVQEALNGLILELSFPTAPPEPNAGPSASPQGVMHKDPNRQLRIQDSRNTSYSLDATKLRLSHCITLDTSIHLAVCDEPLFGMHNRDYPSLWIASLISETTVESPVNLEAFCKTLTARAWEFAEVLLALEGQTGEKLTAMFPTNKNKPQSAEDAFLTFALGTIRAKPRGNVARGPLYQWKLCTITMEDDAPHIGLTTEGRELLMRLEGLTAQTPHAPEHARPFLRHIELHAREDWRCFRWLIDLVIEEPRRPELMERLRERNSEWSDTQVATNLAGYVARAREWGIIEQKLFNGTYRLTEFGKGISNE